MILENAKAMWCMVNRPNTRYEPQYQIDAIITEEQYNQLLDEVKEIKPKFKPKFLFINDEGEYVFRLRRKQFFIDEEGEVIENKKPTCVDENADDFDRNIGNGSLVNVMYDLREWSYKKDSGVKAILKGVQVLDLVPYEEETFTAVGSSDDESL